MHFDKSVVLPEWAGKEHLKPQKIAVVEVPDLSRKDGFLHYEQHELTDTERAKFSGADHVFIPIVRKPKKKKEKGKTEEQEQKEEEEREEKAQVYLVYLKPKTLEVNIFTSQFYDDEGAESDYSDGVEFAKIEVDDDGTES